MDFTWDWGVIAYAAPSMLRGALTTIRVSVIAMVFGTLIGMCGGLLSLSHVAPLRWLVAAYVFLIRGTPALVLIFIVYFALPSIGIDMPPFWAGVAALSLNAGGFITEIFRAGILAIDHGQTEAATAIGMTWRMTLVNILLPQAARNVVPPLTNELISVIKGSSLLSVITIFELTRAAQAVVADKFTPFEIYAALAVYYLVIVGALSLLTRYLEWRLAR
jgi:polar amino acid transport system permease protein